MLATASSLLGELAELGVERDLLGPKLRDLLTVAGLVGLDNLARDFHQLVLDLLLASGHNTASRGLLTNSKNISKLAQFVNEPTSIISTFLLDLIRWMRRKFEKNI